MSVNILQEDGLKRIAGNGGNIEEVEQKLQELETLIEQTKQLRADLESYGMVKLSNATNINDSTGLALPVTEKNPDIEGTLANIIKEKIIYLGSFDIADSDLSEIANDSRNEAYKPYICVNRPITDGKYLHGGFSHVILGMSYESVDGKFQYGFQVSFGTQKILRRELFEGVWGDWGKIQFVS